MNLKWLFGAKSAPNLSQSKAATFFSYFAIIHVRRQREWKRQKAKGISIQQPLEKGGDDGEGMPLAWHPFHAI